MAERCLRCDREDCPTLTLLVQPPCWLVDPVHGEIVSSEWCKWCTGVVRDADDCTKHEQDWRARCLKAEAALEIVKRENDQIASVKFHSAASECTRKQNAIKAARWWIAEVKRLREYANELYANWQKAEAALVAERLVAERKQED